MTTHHLDMEEAGRRIRRLETRIKHLSNDLQVTRKEYESTMAAYFEIYSRLEERVRERTADLQEINTRLSQEIRERKKIEAALRASQEEYRRLYEESKRSEEIYRSLLHTAADAIVMYDLEGRVEYLSPEFTRIFGWRLEELRGSRLPFVPDSERRASEEGIRHILTTGEGIQGFESRRLTKSGDVIDVSISGSRYNDHEGNPAGLLVVLRDITEKKRMEAQFQVAQRLEAIGTLAGGIAHDFNNLLMAIQGNVSMMLQEADPMDPRTKRLREIEGQVQRGADLTRQLLGYARRGRYEVKPIDLNSLVKETAEAFGRTRKDIRIHFDLLPDLEAVEADASQMEQVLLNLFVNAGDAMPEGGRLTLKTDNVTHEAMLGKPYQPRKGRFVQLGVSDTGVGMDSETQQRLFEPFFTTKAPGKGTGLGLASVYGIIKAHGGYIDVFSCPGKGTTFKIYLPTSEKPVSEAVSEPEPMQTTGKGTILLVDDEPVVLDVGSEMLETLGYRVIKASGGRKAVEIYMEDPKAIDLVVLDMVMPDMSGKEVFETLCKVDPEARVILSSGYSLEGQAGEILARGCRGFIQKPFDLKGLAQVVSAALAEDGEVRKG